MKKFHILILLLTTAFSQAQNQVFLVVDSDSKSVIESANIDFLNGKGTHTNTQGVFYLDKNIPHLKISCIGYTTLELNVAAIKDTVFLKRSTEDLKEISIKSEKRKYVSIFPTRNFNNLLPKNFGTGAPIRSILMKAVYIPNENKDTTKVIAKIILYLTDYQTVSLVEKKKFQKQKKQKLAPFKINLYTVDTLIGIPIKRIFAKDIVVELKEGESFLTYELTIDQQINFPLEGVFIALSSFENNYYEKIGFKSGPAFKTIGISADSKFQVFEKSFAYCETDEDCKWFRDQSMWDRKNTYYVGLEVY